MYAVNSWAKGTKHHIYSLVTSFAANSDARVGSSTVTSVARINVERLDGPETEGTFAFSTIDIATKGLAADASVTE